MNSKPRNIVVPKQLLELDAFILGNSTMKDNMALFFWLILYKGGEKVLDGECVKISSQQFGRLIRTSSLKRVKTLLGDIYETDGRFSYRIRGREESLGYCFSDAVSSEDLIEYELRSSKGRKALLKFNEKKKRAPQTPDSNLSVTCKNMHRCLAYFNLDASKVEQLLSTMSLEKREYARSQAVRFSEGGHTISVGETGRVYTAISTMPSAVRALLTVCGENVVRIDIKNSQPTILCELVRKFVPPDELERYQNLVESGRFYEKLAADISSTREIVKMPVVTYLCGPWFEETPSALSKKNLPQKKRAELEILHKVGIWFKEEFPSISEYLRKEKSNPEHKRHFNTPDRRRLGRSCGGYCIISHSLQRLESEIVIDTCCKALFTDYPHIVFATVHDEIIVPVRYNTIVCKYLADAFSKYKLNPKVAIKYSDKSLNA
jgi:hypothetical protein